jgi:glycosyltransferase 2 family protein
LKPESKIKKYAWVALKVALSILGFWYAFKNLDVAHLKQTLLQSNYLLVVCAIIFYLLSQFISSLRLKYVLTAVGDNVSTKWNALLYWQGMAYNLFLPGGIGGDAYKMLAYSKKSEKPAKAYFLPLVADRLFGLSAIIVILGVVGPFVELNDVAQTFVNLSPLFALISLAAGLLVSKKWFSSYLPIYWKSAFYSIGIQLLQIISVLCVLFSLKTNSAQLPETDFTVITLTTFVFLLSSIATAIPVFLGGLGAREVVFATVFTIVSLPPEVGVLVAVIFSSIVVISSLPGLFLGFSKGN